MRRFVIGLLVSGLMVLTAHAADKPAAKPAKAAESFEALKKEYDSAQKKWATEQRTLVDEARKAIQAAKTAEERQAVVDKAMRKLANGPATQFAPRFLAFAEQDPTDPNTFEALVVVVGGTRAAPHGAAWTKALDLLRKHYATKPQIKSVLNLVANNPDGAAVKLLREVIAKNPDRKVQARACKALVDGLRKNVQMAERLRSNEALRKRVEAARGKDAVEKLLASADKAKKDVAELDKLFEEKYADLLPVVGKPAPEVVSHALDGKEVKLSSLKGKVVVVDIWATWCGPCRAMIPHERDMVERLKDKPFALVSISADAQKKTLTDFLAKEKMPWTQWWNGARGGILEDWNVSYFPTIYVLDAKGVIRFKDLRGKELEEAVEKLLEEVK